MGYPSSASTFTPKADGPGNTVLAAHINALQDEIAALEAALLTTGLAHTLKFVDATYDIGASSTTFRPRDLWLSRNALVGGTLGVTGITTLAAALLFSADNTHDIGASGATRPRDLFLGRNAVVGGTLGVTGVGTFTAQSVHNGGVSLGANGQVVFPASQNASAGANTLDDYEEGTWTPVIGGDGGTTGQSYATQLGRYVKVGQMVVAMFAVQLSTEGTITSNVQIQGLPFTVTAIGADSGASALRWDNLATNWVSIMAIPVSGGTACRVKGTTAAAASNGTNLTASDIANTTNFEGCIVYRASA